MRQVAPLTVDSNSTRVLEVVTCATALLSGEVFPSDKKAQAGFVVGSAASRWPSNPFTFEISAELVVEAPPLIVPITIDRAVCLRQWVRVSECVRFPCECCRLACH